MTSTDGTDRTHHTDRAGVRGAGALFPPEVVHTELFQDPAAELLPGEAELVARAVPKRVREFTTARLCARRALARLGHPPVPILRDAKGAPQWPAGVVGTMTHCSGYRGAAVADDSGLAAIGLDAEPHEPLKDPGVLTVISLPQERSRLAGLAVRQPDVRWERLLFSAKESVYKAWYPLTGKWLDFEEADITVDPDDGTFHARLLVPGPVVDGSALAHFDGTWQVRDGLILTAVTVARRPRPAPGPPSPSHPPAAP